MSNDDDANIIDDLERNVSFQHSISTADCISKINVLLDIFENDYGQWLCIQFACQIYKL